MTGNWLDEKERNSMMLVVLMLWAEGRIESRLYRLTGDLVDLKEK